MDADEFIYIEDQSYKYNTASYRTEDIHYSEHDGDLTYHRTIPGSTHTEIYGVDIMAKIKSKFKQRKVRTQVTIWAKSKEGADRALFGSVYWGNKVINDSFYVEVPPKGIAISKYYSLETGITKTTGLLGGIGAALDPKTGKTGTYLESGPIISLSKADEEKKIEGKAIWVKKCTEISLVFEKLKKTNSDPTVSAKNKLAKWNNFYKSIEDDIIGVSKDNEYREETNKFIAHWEWETAAPEIKAAYDNAMDKDSDENLAADLKLKAWTEFINSYQKDFLITDKDDEFRKNAKGRIKYWEWKVEEPVIKAAYNDAMDKDSDEKIAAYLKLAAWDKFLENYSDYDITNEDDRFREDAAKRKIYWNYLNEAEHLYNNVVTIDKDDKLSVKSKLAAWKDFVKNFKTNFPHDIINSDKINQILQTAEKRIEYWNSVKPNPSLHINTVPDNAKIRILNIKPRFYQDMELKAGRYHLEISADNYETKKIWINLPENVHKTLSIKLNSPRDGRYIAYKNGAVLDTETNLMWQQADDGKRRNWRNAKKYCQHLILAGHSDWRLPTEDELKTLFVKGRKPVAISKMFKCKSSEPYWSSIVVDHNTRYENAFAVWFDKYGNVTRSLSENYLLQKANPSKLEPNSRAGKFFGKQKQILLKNTPVLTKFGVGCPF